MKHSPLQVFLGVLFAPIILPIVAATAAAEILTGSTRIHKVTIDPLDKTLGKLGGFREPEATGA